MSIVNKRYPPGMTKCLRMLPTDIWMSYEDILRFVRQFNPILRIEALGPSLAPLIAKDLIEVKTDRRIGIRKQGQRTIFKLYKLRR